MTPCFAASGFKVLAVSIILAHKNWSGSLFCAMDLWYSLRRIGNHMECSQRVNHEPGQVVTVPRNKFLPLPGGAEGRGGIDLEGVCGLDFAVVVQGYHGVVIVFRRENADSMERTPQVTTYVAPQDMTKKIRIWIRQTLCGVMRLVSCDPLICSLFRVSLLACGVVPTTRKVAMLGCLGSCWIFVVRACETSSVRLVRSIAL